MNSRSGLFVPLAAMAWLAAAVAPATCVPTPVPVNVLTFHNDTFRSGYNPQETILQHSNVNSTAFGKLFSYPVDGYLYAEPLYVSQLAIPASSWRRGVRSCLGRRNPEIRSRPL